MHAHGNNKYAAGTVADAFFLFPPRDTTSTMVRSIDAALIIVGLVQFLRG